MPPAPKIGAGPTLSRQAKSFKKAIGAYVQSLRDSKPPPVPGIEGLLELQAEAGLKRSIAQRRPVRLNEEFPVDGA